MKKQIVIFILGLCCTVQSMQAQSIRTVETQKDRYGRVTGTATTTTKNGKSVTVYKDRYCHITGKAESRTRGNGRVETTYKDEYGRGYPIYYYV